jgi:outer membrane protein assembly factor BamA
MPDDESILHPRARFYAGGVESVRGYGENQLGPRVLRVRREELLARGCTEASIADGSCDPNVAPSTAFSPRPVGATALLEGSAEFRLPLAGPLGAVAFADGAALRAGSLEPSRPRVAAVTPGVGLRYSSTLGILRLDAGYRPGGRERLPVVVESQSPDGTARVVRLRTEKVYDEAAGSGGSLRRALRRVTVHFALGHAF